MAIEIGAGICVFTRELAKRRKAVLAVELGRKLLHVLDETLREEDE